MRQLPSCPQENQKDWDRLFATNLSQPITPDTSSGLLTHLISPASTSFEEPLQELAASHCVSALVMRQLLNQIKQSW
jgi:hypothetical protein